MCVRVCACTFVDPIGNEKMSERDKHCGQSCRSKDRTWQSIAQTSCEDVHYRIHVVFYALGYVCGQTKTREADWGRFDRPGLLLLFRLLLLHSPGRNARRARDRSRSAILLCMGRIDLRLRCLRLCFSVRHLLHEREVEGLKPIEEDRRGRLKLETLRYKRR